MGDAAYDLVVTFSRRRTIALRLEYGDSRVYIKAPIGISEERILLIVSQKQRWIGKRMRELAERETQKREFTDGSEHLFLGNPITLKINAGKNGYVFENDVLTISARNTEPKQIERLLYKWYAEQAQALFPKIAAPLTAEFAVNHKAIPSHFEYKRVKSYWGQCVGQRFIRINTELVRARESSIRMIFAHELCHLVHPNHSKRFYGLLEKYCPDWKAEVKYLKENIRLKY